MLKNLIFDFGGVLIDWDPHAVYDPYFNDAERCSWFMEHICTQSFILEGDAGKPVPQVCEEHAARHPEWAEPIRMFWTHWPEMITGPIPGMYALLKQLKAQGFHLWGLTNWGRETFRLVRDTFPAFRLLEGMVVSSEEGVIKPDPRIYRILLERYGLRPEESVFVDDRAPNADAARALGMDAIVFENSDRLAQELAGRYKIKL
ncbi:MAG: HAD family phosphatase [Bacteroidales bacterium]|nr:HAD family phosphatase [Bacteroidales bacterium]